MNKIFRQELLKAYEEYKGDVIKLTFPSNKPSLTLSNYVILAIVERLRYSIDDIEDINGLCSNLHFIKCSKSESDKYKSFYK